VILGEPGIGKTRLLQYAEEAAGDMRTAGIAGVESEVRLGFAALHACWCLSSTGPTGYRFRGATRWLRRSV
jgi:hypothetical protein